MARILVKMGNKIIDPHPEKLRGIKILFIFATLKIGGSERQGLLLASFLKNDLEADVEIWGLSKELGELTQLCEANRVPWKNKPFFWTAKWYLTPVKIVELLKLTLLLRKNKPDIILSYTWLPNVVCGLTGKIAGAKLCVWNQRDEGIGLKGTFWERQAIKRTSFFLSNTERGKELLINKYGPDPRKVFTIVNGIELPSPIHDRNTWRSNLKLNNNSFLACMVANIHRNKDHPTLLKAWRMILDRCKDEGRKPHLVIAGRFYEGEKELKSLVAELNLGENVKFLGMVDDVSGLLHSCDLYVHSSTSEGLPNAVLEAMAAGLPVVATDIPGIRECFGESGWDFLSPVGNSAILSDYLWKLYQDDNLRLKIGASLKEHVRATFSPSDMCNKTVSLLASFKIEAERQEDC